VQEIFENQRRADGSSTFNAAALEEGDPSRWCTSSLVSVTPNTHPISPVRRRVCEDLAVDKPSCLNGLRDAGCADDEPQGHSVLKQWVMVVDPQITDSGVRKSAERLVVKS
jgi:hypothetical protein